MRGASLIAAIACALASQNALSGEFPPFPKPAHARYPDDLDKLRAFSEAGDGYATLLLAGRLDCSKGDVACLEKRAELYEEAVAQGQSLGVPLARLTRLEIDPSRTAEYEISPAVCGRSASDSDALVASITDLHLPSRDEARGFEMWGIQELSGEEGSKAFLLSNSAMWIFLIFRDDQLIIARVFTNLLAIGSEEQRGSAIFEINKNVSTILCPRWSGLGDKIIEYILASFVWPPQGVHAEGDQAWLALTSVVPDITWYDLYVDPFHQPFTSRTREKFDPSANIGLDRVN